MTIEIKISKKPVEYQKAVKFLENRLVKIIKNQEKELIWVLSHNDIYTGGTSFNKNEILDKNIDVIKTSRGGKITYHGKGQVIFYFVINLNKRKKDIRKFINVIENTIIMTLKDYKIISQRDSKNIGIWVKYKNKLCKVGAIGIKIKKWIAYHGFSINIKTNLKNFNKIIPCGIKNRKVINLKNIKNDNFYKIEERLIKNFILNLNDLN